MRRDRKEQLAECVADEMRAVGFQDVAMDRIGWRIIDQKRAAAGMLPVAEAKPDADSNFLHCQPEHIELAGALGLGEFDQAKIDWRRLTGS